MCEREYIKEEETSEVSMLHMYRDNILLKCTHTHRDKVLMVHMYRDNIQHKYMYIYKHIDTKRESEGEKVIISRDIYTHRKEQRDTTPGEKLIIYRETVRVFIEQVLRLENSLSVTSAENPRRGEH